jgi:3-deoxy-D-manno-octulosonic-acid transferase
MNFYFWLMDRLTSGWIARYFGHLYGLRRARLEAYQVSVAPLNAGESPLWFHGASVGELEMIAPLLDRALELGIPCSVSAFSDSALPWLLRLQQHPHARHLRYLGLSPRERDWHGHWENLRVRGLFIAKYDFWPGMWAAASALGIEVNIVNARARESWSRLDQLMRLLRIPAPKLRFFATTETLARPLQEKFPRAAIELAPDPRRYRIRARAERKTPEAQTRHRRQRLGLGSLADLALDRRHDPRIDRGVPALL